MEISERLFKFMVSNTIGKGYEDARAGNFASTVNVLNWLANGPTADKEISSMVNGLALFALEEISLSQEFKYAPSDSLIKKNYRRLEEISKQL